jgi:hypothetical protein
MENFGLLKKVYIFGKRKHSGGKWISFVIFGQKWSTLAFWRA